MVEETTQEQNELPLLPQMNDALGQGVTGHQGFPDMEMDDFEGSLIECDDTPRLKDPPELLFHLS